MVRVAAEAAEAVGQRARVQGQRGRVLRGGNDGRARVRLERGHHNVAHGRVDRRRRVDGAAALLVVAARERRLRQRQRQLAGADRGQGQLHLARAVRAVGVVVAMVAMVVVVVARLLARRAAGWAARVGMRVVRVVVGRGGRVWRRQRREALRKRGDLGQRLEGWPAALATVCLDLDGGQHVRVVHVAAPALGTPHAVLVAVVPVLDGVVAADADLVALEQACNLGPFGPQY